MIEKIIGEIDDGTLFQLFDNGSLKIYEMDGERIFRKDIFLASKETKGLKKFLDENLK